MGARIILDCPKSILIDDANSLGRSKCLGRRKHDVLLSLRHHNSASRKTPDDIKRHQRWINLVNRRNLLVSADGDRLVT